MKVPVQYVSQKQVQKLNRACKLRTQSPYPKAGDRFSVALKQMPPVSGLTQFNSGFGPVLALDATPYLKVNGTIRYHTACYLKRNLNRG